MDERDNKKYSYKFALPDRGNIRRLRSGLDKFVLLKNSQQF